MDDITKLKPFSFGQISTWLDAVDDAEEGVSVPPAGPEVADLDSELVRDLVSAPVEQGLLGAHLPLLLPAAGATARWRAAVVLRLAAGAAHHGGTEALAQLGQDASILFNLEVFAYVLVHTFKIWCDT